jgi:hypothetical protein
LVPIDEVAGNGTVNNCIEAFGYTDNQVHTIYTFDSSNISCIGFIIFTREPLFVLAESSEHEVSISDVNQVLENIDWSFEYSALNVEAILQNGVDVGNFDLEFLKSAIDLCQEDEGLFKSNSLGLYLQFQSNKLVAFSSSEWQNTSLKWLMDVNHELVSCIVSEAKRFQRNEFEAIQEANIQASSLLMIPDGVDNENISLHTKNNGNIHFYNLMVAHYGQECKKDEFLFMNKGRLNKISNSVYEVNNLVYSFNTSDELIEVSKK